MKLINKEIKDQAKVLIEKKTVTRKDLKKRPLSYSSLKYFLTSPLHFCHAWHRKRFFLPTPAMQFGSLVDCLMLTPENLEKEYMVIPKINKRTKAGQEQWKEIQETMKEKDLEPITEEDLIIATAMVKAAYENPMSKRLLDNVTRTQRRCEWVDKKTKLPMISYTDAEGEIDNRPFILELKTMADAEMDVFARSCINFNYPLQAGTYFTAFMSITGLVPDYYYLIMEKPKIGDVTEEAITLDDRMKTPIAVNVGLASSDFIQLGRQQYRRALDGMANCIDEQNFHKGYEFRAIEDDLYNTLDLPGWAKKELS